MAKGNLLLALAVTAAGAVFATTGTTYADDVIPMYRMYNPNSGEHFYTAHKAERNHLVSLGWNYEGGAWSAPASGDPVYRLYNKNAGDHHYTTSKAERDHLVSVGWNYENIGWYSGGKNAVYRLYNPNAKAGAHHYTLNKGEYNSLAAIGWKGEDIGWYAADKFVADDVEAVMNQYSPSRKKPQQKDPIPVPEPQLPSTPSQKTENTTPRRVDKNITGIGGQAADAPGSYRLLYSNKPFDTVNLDQAVPTIEFSADMQFSGSRSAGSFYGTQFIIAGTSGGEGQIGLDISYQDGGSAPSKAFAQNRISVKTVNFPDGSGTNGEQYYTINTNAADTGTASISVKYYQLAEGEYVVTYYNGMMVGCYQTKLGGSGTYILHAQVDDDKGTGAVVANYTNVKVFSNGKDVTDDGIQNIGSSFNLTRGGNWLVQGIY